MDDIAQRSVILTFGLIWSNFFARFEDFGRAAMLRQRGGNGIFELCDSEVSKGCLSTKDITCIYKYYISTVLVQSPDITPLVPLENLPRSQVETATETHWQMLIKVKPQLFDGAVWCLRNFAVDGRSLLLDMQDGRA